MLDSLFIDTQLEWEGVFSGRYSDDQIASRLHKLRKLQHDAERLTFKEGLPRKISLLKKSEDEALAREVPQIDVIISGHTHTILPKPIVTGKTIIVSAGCYGE